jgi:hypothetical protein
MSRKPTGYWDELSRERALHIERSVPTGRGLHGWWASGAGSWKCARDVLADSLVALLGSTDHGDDLPLPSGALTVARMTSLV